MTLFNMKVIIKVILIVLMVFLFSLLIGHENRFVAYIGYLGVFFSIFYLFSMQHKS